MSGSRTIRYWTAGLTIAALRLVASAADFEGSVVYRETNPQYPSEPPVFTRYSLRPGFVRTESLNPAPLIPIPILIFDEGRRLCFSLSEQNQNFLVMPLDYRDPRTPEEREAFAREMKRTETTAMIQGRQCRLYTLRDEENTIQAWFTNEIGSFPGPETFSQKFAARYHETSALFRKVFGEDLFLIRLIKLDSHMTERFRFEAAEIQVTTLPEKLFKVPANYKQLQLPRKQPARQ